MKAASQSDRKPRDTMLPQEVRQVESLMERAKLIHIDALRAIDRKKEVKKKRITAISKQVKQLERQIQKLGAKTDDANSRHEKKITVNSTITVRKMFQGGGIEKVFLLNSPWIKSITVSSSAKIKRAKLYYLRKRTGKSARLKQLF